jgi:hypothetical protein
MDREYFTAKAWTLKDLHDRIGDARKALGDDAEWTGYDDGRIYVWTKDGLLLLTIEVGCDEGGLNDNAKTGHEATEHDNGLSGAHSC